MSACPGCGVEISDEDLHAQVEHMEAHHPEIIRERLERAGFEVRDDGTVIDLLSDGYVGGFPSDRLVETYYRWGDGD